MNDWHLRYQGLDPSTEGLREALCTLGNGYFATRGAAIESIADGIHYPGTYLAGGYDRLSSEVAGRSVENEDLVNLPNWLALRWRITGGDWFDPARVELLEHEQVLDMQRGVLERVLRFRDEGGRCTRVAERRLVHMEQPHLAAVELRITAENWSGTIEVRSAIDGRVRNAGVERYRELDGQHLEPLRAQSGADALFLKMRTRQSRLEVALAARTRLLRDAEDVTPAPALLEEPDQVAQTFGLQLDEAETITVEKVVALFTSRDHAISECGLAARELIGVAADFPTLLESHTLEWAHLWRRFDIGIAEGDAAIGDRNTCVLRLHIFHLLQTTSPHSIDLDVGVPARGWHGEAYRGHIFWDELFIFPLLNLRLPEITRSLLLYRYRRLDAARANARQAGYGGAMYPWQSGSDGREETQRLHLNPRSGRWTVDSTHLQRHVNAAIAYNIWQYYQASGDLEFISFSGAEVFLEIARFWASIATYNDKLGRYEIRGVIGPDEFQTGYPGAESPGLNNHAYTNLMAVWVLWRARDLLAILPEERRHELCERLSLTDSELAHWDEVSSKMRIVFHNDGIISQFEGYDELEEFDWDGYRARYGDIHRLDRILEAEGDTPNRYKAAKQADVLMLFYLFSAEELAELFGRLGYPFEYETIPRNVAYYAQRSSNGSTLSRVVHAWVLSRSDRPQSWQVFQEALGSDVADIQGGTTREGIHLGAMAGTVDLVQRCYTGIVTQGDTLWFNPCIPQALAQLQMCLRYRGHALDVNVTQQLLEIRARKSNAAPIRIGLREQVHELAAGESKRFDLRPPRRRAAAPTKRV
jgi:alpha,alpha-trehalase